MGQLIISNAISLNGAFEAPSPPPDGWLVLDSASLQASLEMWQAADAMVMGRKTYQGLAAVWPLLADHPGYEAFAHRMNSMPKYVASRTLRGPLTWNSTLLEGDVADRLKALKSSHHGNLIVTGAGELAHFLLERGVVDELRFGVSPYLWPTGPRIFETLGAIRLETIGARAFPSGVVHLSYRPVRAEGSAAG